MSFLDLVRTRRSVRRYDSSRPVAREAVERCLEAARLAPSACNAQPWRFVVVDDPDLRDRLARKTFGPLVSFNHFSLQAPVLVAVVAEETRMVPRLGGLVKGKRYSVMDIGIAAEHFCLQAAEDGLGTCMLGWFDERAARRLLAVPSTRRIVLIITLGHPADDASRRRGRKTMEEMRSYNRY